MTIDPIYDALCHELVRAAGLNADELQSGYEREITYAELTALGEAFIARIDYYNLHFRMNKKKPTSQISIAKTWNDTVGKYWGLKLHIRRLNRNLGRKTYFINHGAK